MGTCDRNGWKGISSLGKAGISRNRKASVEIGIIDTWSDLERIRGPWDEMASAQGGHAAFLCFDWFRLWARHFLKEQDLRVVAIFDREGIVGIAPCLCARARVYGVSSRRIELLGNVYSPFRFFVVPPDPDRMDLFLSHLVEFLVEGPEPWDLMELSPIPEEKRWFEALKEAVEKSGVAHQSFTAFGDWYLDDIDFTGETYVARLPKKLRKDVAYCRRRLEREGEVEIRIVQEPAQVDAHMDLYYQVYGRSWQKREAVGPTFHRDLARLAARKGWLRLGFLFHRGIPISTQFWITCSDMSFILKTVYDQEYRKFSPGKVLTVEMMKYAIDVDGVRTVDYGQGDEAYKRDWTPKRRERKGLVIFNRTLVGRYLSLVQKRIRPALAKSSTLREVARRMRAVGGGSGPVQRSGQEP